MADTSTAFTFSTLASRLHQHAWSRGAPPSPITAKDAQEQYNALCDHIEQVSRSTISLHQCAAGIDMLISLLQTSSEPDSFFAKGMVGLLVPMREELERTAAGLEHTIEE